MLLAMPGLSRAGFEVNAHGCRQYPEALALLSGLAHEGRLPHLVAIALGANGQIESGNVEEALRILGPGRVLVLLTPRELGGGSGSDAQLVRAEGRRHGGRLVVLDWVAYSASHPSWFEPDGLHVNPTGAAGLTRLISRVLPIASTAPAVRPPRCPPPPAPSSPPPVPPLPAQPPAPVPPTALGAIAIGSHGGVLLVSRRGERLDVPIANENPFAVTGVARVEQVGSAGSRLLAAACVGAAAHGSSPLTIKVGAELVADAELLARFQARVLLTFTDPEGRSETIARTYVLRGIPR